MLPSRGQLTPTSLEGAAGRQSGSTSNHSRGQRREPGSSSLRFRSLLDSVGLPSPSLDDSAEEAHRPKRRRLDSRKPTPDFKAIRYGRYGQVEPGQLKMEIVSCDGGMYSNELSYAAENILKDDASVYCTQSPRCNIVLRHQGETVFNLTELVIKAPRNNYTSP